MKTNARGEALLLLTIVPEGHPAVSGWYTTVEALRHIMIAQESGIPFTFTIKEE